MSQPVYFPDGYTRKGYIKGVDNHYGSVAFEYRPMLPEERDDILHAVRTSPPGRWGLAMRQALASKVTSWDVTNPMTGKAVPVELDAVKRLPPDVFDRLFNIVSGSTASDPAPDATEEEATSYVDDLLKAASSGRREGDIRTEADAKNSSAA